MTEEQKAEVIRLYKLRIRVASISKLIGDVTDGSVKRYIYKTLGIATRNTKHRINTFDKIKKLRLSGKSVREIESIVKLNKNQINYLLRKAGTSFKEIDKSRGN